MKTHKYLFYILASEIVLLLSYYSITFLNKGIDSYNLMSAFFIIIWVMMTTVFGYKAYKDRDLISPLIIYLFSLTIFVFFVLFMDMQSNIVFKMYPYEYKTEENLFKSIGMIILSVIAFYLPSRLIKLKKSNIKKYGEVNSFLDNKKVLLIINFILLLIVILADIYISKKAYGSIFGRITKNYASGAELSILRLLIYLYPMVIINFCYIYFKFGLSMPEKISVILICLFIVSVNFLGGNRALILSSIIGSLALYYKVRGINLKAVVFVGLIGIVMYTSFVFMQSYRVDKEVASMTSYKWQYDTLDIALLVTDRYPRIENFSYGGSIKSLILNPIPRKYYKNKPIAFGSHLGKITNPQDPNTVSSYAAVTPIEFYANFGVMGMLIFTFMLSCILHKIYYTFGKSDNINLSTLLYINFIVGLYMVFRGDFTTKTIHLFLPLIIFEVVKWIVYLCSYNRKRLN